MLTLYCLVTYCSLGSACTHMLKGRTHACTHARTHTRTQVHTHAHAHVRVHMHIRTYTHTLKARVWMHTRTHTVTHVICTELCIDTMPSLGPQREPQDHSWHSSTHDRQCKRKWTSKGWNMISKYSHWHPAAFPQRTRQCRLLQPNREGREGGSTQGVVREAWTQTIHKWRVSPVTFNVTQPNYKVQNEYGRLRHRQVPSLT